MREKNSLDNRMEWKTTLNDWEEIEIKSTFLKSVLHRKCRREKRVDSFLCSFNLWDLLGSKLPLLFLGRWNGRDFNFSRARESKKERKREREIRIFFCPLWHSLLDFLRLQRFSYDSFFHPIKLVTPYCVFQQLFLPWQFYLLAHNKK